MAIDPKILAQAHMARERMQTRPAAVLERFKPLMDAERKRMQDYYSNQLAESHARMKAARNARDVAQGNVNKKVAPSNLASPQLAVDPAPQDKTAIGINKVMASPQLGPAPLSGINTPQLRGSTYGVNDGSTAPVQDFAQQANTTGMDKTAIGVNKAAANTTTQAPLAEAAVMKRGGAVKKMASGGSVKKMASGGIVRGNGCAVRGRTKGRMV